MVLFGALAAVIAFGIARVNGYTMSTNHGTERLLGWLLVILLNYFVPTLIAHYRKHHNREAIFWLNLLLGWTGLGWIAAFVWAFTKPAPVGPPPMPPAPRTW